MPVVDEIYFSSHQTVSEWKRSVWMRQLSLSFPSASGCFVQSLFYFLLNRRCSLWEQASPSMAVILSEQCWGLLVVNPCVSMILCAGGELSGQDGRETLRVTPASSECCGNACGCPKWLLMSHVVLLQSCNRTTIKAGVGTQLFWWCSNRGCNECVLGPR